MLIAFIVIIIIIVAFVGWTISVYNSFITLRERVSNAKAQIAAQIESRWDAVSNLISATKQYAKHETELLENITEKRASLGRDSSMEEIEDNDAQLNNVVGRLIAISENYPDLKASEVYKQSMESVNKFEDNVRHSRMIYNDVVTRFNRKLKQFPTNMIGGMFNFKEQSYFEQTEAKAEMPSWE
ncbi:MAG TPA: LemA family protein [Pseudogracilibacillus sp.]|nr:LemA family protein [Pseudogracilibacillus sp.]